MYNRDKILLEHMKARKIIENDSKDSDENSDTNKLDCRIILLVNGKNNY